MVLENMEHIAGIDNDYYINADGDAEYFNIAGA